MSHSQFAFSNELNSALSMDDPLIRGPVPRWQKKLHDGSVNSSTVSNGNASKLKPKTPSKDTRKTPTKTPKPSPGRAKTPNGGDRFIPNRSASDFELGQLKLALNAVEDEVDDTISPSKAESQRALSENLLGKDVSKAKILAFQKKAPGAPDGYQNSLKVVYSSSKTPSARAASRYIPQAPDRILDAPDIVDDYYLNLVDWSSSNVLAVALRNSVYLWNAGVGSITHLTEFDENDYACSLNWVKEGDSNVLAVGNSLGTIQLWDVVQTKKLRTMDGHSARVSSLSWNGYILSSGCRSGLIVHHDVRHVNHNVSTINAHSQEVCGLKWSPDGRYLASGGNDNILNVWAQVPGEKFSQSEPLHSFTAHQAAVKALAWCPWQSGYLASGGGTADRHIRIWNCNTGTAVNSVDTKSQVCGILWSTHYKELISGHGFANNQLTIWKYPSLTKIAELTGHSARVLHLALSPDGSTVLSAGADETLRLWKCFTPSPKLKKDLGETSAFAGSILKKGNIR